MEVAYSSNVDWEIDAVAEVDALTVATQPEMDGVEDGIIVVGRRVGVLVGALDGLLVILFTQNINQEMVEK